MPFQRPPETNAPCARSWLRTSIAALVLLAASGTYAFAQSAVAQSAVEWTAKSKSEAESNPDAALADIDKAIALEDAAFRRYEKGLILQRLHRNSEAITQFEAARATDPNNATILFTLGYAYRAAGRNHDAVGAFQAGLQIDPSRYDVVEDLAYALKDDGRPKAANKSFHDVLDNRGRYPQTTDAQKLALDKRMFRVGREIDAIERNWYATAFLTYRSSDAQNLPSVVNSNPFTSQGGAEVGWSPLLGGMTEHSLDIYGRSYFSFRAGTLDYDSKSLQFGVGVRWKPFATQDFRLTLERMIKSGSNARNAWLTRASYSWNDGADIDPFATDWNYTSFYGDVAYIPTSPTFFSVYGQLEQGWRFRFGDATAITPHGVISTQYTSDKFRDDWTTEIGAGVTLSRWYDGGEYPSNSRRVDLIAEYRTPLSSTTHDRGHALLQLVVFR